MFLFSFLCFWWSQNEVCTDWKKKKGCYDAQESFNQDWIDSQLELKELASQFASYIVICGGDGFSAFHSVAVS